MKKIILMVFSCLLTIVALADNHKATVTWTAVFSNITPRSAEVSQAYCDSHSTTVMVTTIDEITSEKGVKTLNGLYVKYNSYDHEIKDGLLFNIVDAQISGVDEKGPWTLPMKLYEQTLSEEDHGVTWTVWSTPKCKGTFIGTPTLT